MHTAPDGLSRNPPGRDRLILAQQKDWIDFRARIQGLQKAIERGEADDEEPVALTLEHLLATDPEALDAAAW